MKIVADDQIAYVHEAFSDVAEVVLCAGRKITTAQLRDADALLVRSVTTVNEDLLNNSQVKFVATATSGDDHVDTNYLRENGIGFVSAKGSNARSVAEYVLSCLCVLAERYRFKLSNKKVGVIGCGEVGSRVMALLNALDVATLPNDPPLQAAVSDRTDPPPRYRDLGEVLTADVITLHVPLTDSGAHPTRHLVNTNFLSALKKGVVLINTSRGEVLDEAALKHYLVHQPQCKLVLDVWQNEPRIDVDLLATAEIGTPHIAGYSMDAKLCAARAVIQSTRAFFGIKTTVPLPDNGLSAIDLMEFGRDDQSGDEALIRMAVLAAYDVRNDSESLRFLHGMRAQHRADHFDALRKQYPVRREFPSMVVRLPRHKITLTARLERLGFGVECLA